MSHRQMVAVVYEGCCGLDIRKQTVVACLVVPGRDMAPHQEICTFGTMTEDLLQLADWLTAAGYARSDGEHRRVLEADL